METNYTETEQELDKLNKRVVVNEKRINEHAKENAESLLTLQSELDGTTFDNSQDINTTVSFSQATTKFEEKINALNIEDIDTTTNTITDKWSVNEEVPLPDIPTNVKFYTDYRCYNISGSPHLRMQNLSYTDELGCRRYNDDYCVGLGSFYSERIGDRFEVTLDTGKVFTVITGDMKADCDTDPTNMYGPCINYDLVPSANVLEFIIDGDIVPEEISNYGSLDYHEEFKGNIVKMVYLGRDNSMDWDKYE